MPELSPTTEQEIANLERVLAEKRAAFEQQKVGGAIQEVPHAKEILRETVKEKLAPSPGAPPPPPPPPAPQPAASVKPGVVPLPSYLSEELQAKVKELVEMAFAKSLNEAIETAKATQNPALIDAFHDMIVDELYQHLVESGKLQRVD